MAEDLNSVTLVGRLTRDADVRGYGSEGQQVANCRLAFSSRERAPSGEWGDVSNYVDVVIWNVAGLAEYLTQGQQLAVKGRLRWREWTSEDGTKRQALEVVADGVQLLASVKDREPAAAA